jgi:hypothetical protein
VSSLFGLPCVLGAWCATEADGGQVCRAWDSVGAPCADFYGSNCSGYDYCADAPDGGRSCAGYAASGQPCGSEPPVNCKAGLACSAYDGGGTCGTLLGQGAPCRIGECAPPLFCIYAGPLASLGTCQIPGGVDAGCVVTDDCATGLACAANGHCVTPGGPNQPCGTGECITNYVCTNGTCAPTFCMGP